jgi:hypothetical protein
MLSLLVTIRIRKKHGCPSSKSGRNDANFLRLKKMEPRKSDFRKMMALVSERGNQTNIGLSVQLSKTTAARDIRPEAHVGAAGAVVSNGVFSDNGPASNDEEALRDVTLRHHNAVGHVQLQLHFPHLNGHG